MFKWYKDYKENLLADEWLYMYKLDTEKYSERTKTDNIVFLSDFKTWYHLTPNDLGKEIILEPRQSDGCERFIVEAGLEHEARQFKAISFSDNICDCLFRMPHDKLLDFTKYYIYATFEALQGWHNGVLEDNGKKVIYNNEIRLFKKTKCKRIGIVEFNTDLSNKIRMISTYGDIETLDKYIKVIPDKKSIYIPIKKGTV